MTVEFEDISHDILYVKAKGKLTDEDYERFVPKINQMLENGKINILFELEDFEGWTPIAALDDTSFGMKHFNDIEKIAFVGNRELEKGMALFFQTFTTADVRFFKPDDIDNAKRWIGIEKRTEKEIT